MNEHIKTMIKNGIIVGGKITMNDGFATFQRLQLEDLEMLDETEIAYATQSMGRAVFQIDKDNKIRNIKGVDSHLDNKEIALAQLSGAKSVYLTIDGKPYQESTHPINLVVFPNKQLDIRIRGTSPLEDIEIEADINAKMQNLGIKLPQIMSIREYSYEIAKILGLPTKIEGSYEEFISDYATENDARKQNLHNIYGERYFEDLPIGLRPEKMSEYFERIGILNTDEFKRFATENGFSIDDFIQYVDKSYSLGQRYGQAIRKMESPFRISDLEYYVENEDIVAIQEISDFTDEMLDSGIPFENIFAKQIGTNIANMMNAGWMCENFVHRQDYSLRGEMCDDSYIDLAEQFKQVEAYNKYDEGKRQTIKSDKTRQFFLQVFLMSSNIKVLQDEMKLKGKSKDEIESILNDFIQNFVENIDFQKIANAFGTTLDEVEQYFTQLLESTNDYVKLMAGQSRENKVIYDEAILRAHKENNDFYKQVSFKIAKQLLIKKNNLKGQSDILSEAISETERTTRTGTINKQVFTIKEEMQPTKDGAKLDYEEKND